MDELKRIVDFVSNYGQGPNSLINFQDEVTLEGKLFHLLQSGKVKSDQEAASALYGNSEVSNSFRMLKSRFQKKLFNNLHLLKNDVRELSSVNGAEYQCLALLLEAQALRLIFESKLAIKVLQKLLQVADDHALTEMKIKALENMSMIYISLNDAVNHDKIESTLSKYYRIESLEREAKRIYNRIRLKSRGTVANKSVIISEFPTIIQMLEELWTISHSSRVFNYLHKVSILYLEQQGKYAEIVTAVTRAEQLVEEKKLSRSWYDSNYNHYIRVYALLQARNYTEGLKMASLGYTYFNKADVNWFAFMENYFLLALHAKDYTLACSLILEVTSDTNFLKLPEDAMEHWALYCKYYRLLTNSKESEISHKIASVNYTFSILSKDKSGFNLTLLNLDVVEALAKSKTDAEQQAERVRKYASKYLKGEKAERPRLFMRMLQLALQEQSVAVVQERGGKLLKKLEETPLPGDAFAEVEVVPYEHLWALVLELLQHRHNQ